MVEAIRGIKTDFKKLEEDLVSIREKMLPAFAEALPYGTAGGWMRSRIISLAFDALELVASKGWEVRIGSLLGYEN